MEPEPTNYIPMISINNNNVIQNERQENNDACITYDTIPEPNPDRVEKYTFESIWKNLFSIQSFVIVFSIINILQSALKTYLRMSIKNAATILGYDQYGVEWFLTTIGLTQGAFILIVIYYLQRYHIHPIRSISLFILIEAIFCSINISITLNNIFNSLTMNEQNSINQYSLCEPNVYDSPKSFQGGKIYNILIILSFFIQLIVSLTDGVIYCIGITYIDDNSNSRKIPLYFGIVLGSYVLGTEFGIVLIMNIESKLLDQNIGCLILILLILFFNIYISFFPKKLKKVITTNLYLKEFTFLPIIKRLFYNKILIFNIIALVLIETAIINYTLKEENYIKSRFLIISNVMNGFHTELLYRFLFIILRPVLISITILLSGFIITAYIINIKKLLIWNIIIEILICLIFITNIFLNCSKSSDNTLNSNKNIMIQSYYCSNGCFCNVPFNPVCPENSNQTYYSPCHAGCKSIESIDNIIMFKNCSCGDDISKILIHKTTATLGACNNENCEILSSIYHILILLGGMLLGTCIVGRLLITLRNTLPQDKSLSLALQLTIAGLIVNIPGKLIYDYFESLNCVFWSTDKKACLLHNSTHFGNNLHTTSFLFIVFAILFDILVIIFMKNVE